MAETGEKSPVYSKAGQEGQELRLQSLTRHEGRKGRAKDVSRAIEARKGIYGQMKAIPARVERAKSQEGAKEHDREPRYYNRL